MSNSERPRRRGHRTRYLLSIRYLVLVVVTSILFGFMIGYGLAFLQWWNR